MKDAVRAPVFEGARSAWEFVDPGVARFELTLVLHHGGPLAGWSSDDVVYGNPVFLGDRRRDRPGRDLLAMTQALARVMV